MQISSYITLQDACKSATAQRLGIDNAPNNEQTLAMQRFCANVYDRVCEKFGKIIPFNSFFRSEKLNKAIGGSRNSQHCKGEAIDLDGNSNLNATIFNYIKDNLDFDQLIWEFGDKNCPDWVHVSCKKNGNRKQVLKSVKEKGKTIYKNY